MTTKPSAEKRAQEIVATYFGTDELGTGRRDLLVELIKAAIEQAVEQARAETLAAALELVEQRIDVYAHEKRAGTEADTMLQAIIERLLNLPPSSDVLKKLLLRVAERVREECYDRIVAQNRSDAAIGIRALDLDRIVEEVLK